MLVMAQSTVYRNIILAIRSVTISWYQYIVSQLSTIRCTIGFGSSSHLSVIMMNWLTVLVLAYVFASATFHPRGIKWV